MPGATGGGATTACSVVSADLADRATRPPCRASCSAPCSKTSSTPENPKQPESDVPDVLGARPDGDLLRDQPGSRLRRRERPLRQPAQRLLAAAARGGLHTPALRARASSSSCSRSGIGVTNAAYRTTPGSGDLRKADFAGSAERLERIALELGRARSASSARRRIAAPSANGRARATRAPPRRDGALRAPFDLACQRCGAVGERLRWFQAFFDALSTKVPSTVSQPSS